MRQLRASPDHAIADVATRQHGVVSVGQLHAAGFSQDMIKRRAKVGYLHRIHRGVYAIGHRGVPLEGRWMAAVLAVGDGAALSHRSAAALWALLPTRRGNDVDIIVRGYGGKRKRAGIRVHRTSSLESSDLTRRQAIPVTTAARTISDLRGVVTPREMRRACRQAAVMGLSIGANASWDRARSELESLFLRLCRHYRLPPPEANVRIGGLLVDFVWRDRRLIVETDGYRYHRGRVAFEDDRARDLHLRTLGYEVIRLTHDQVVKQSGETAAALKEVIAR
jgi:very-short-patch-repair endonuclease